ncbi:MAG: FUSC family protein [Parachlamydiaceae bacterium]|nr:FUSC family protein [Parachlamydiaceae bacterium]
MFVSLAQLKEFGNRIEYKVAIKTGLAGALGWTIGTWFSHLTKRPDSLVSGLWCTVAAIVVLQANIGGTYQAAINRFLGVFIGSVLGGFCTSLFGSNPQSLALSIFCTVIICSFLNIKDSLRIACMSVSMVMILWDLHPVTSPWDFAFFRFIDSCLGILIGVGIAHVIWPFQAARKLRLNIAQCLLSMNQLYQFIRHTTDWNPTAEAEFTRLVGEIDSQMEQNKQFLEEAKLELIMQPLRLDNWSLLQSHLEKMFTEVISLRQVYTTSKKIFAIALDAPLTEVQNQIENTLTYMSQQLNQRKPVGALTELSSSLAQLQVDLLNFRNTHATSKYNFQEVESFFVFSYELTAVVEELLEIAQKIDVLYAEVAQAS